MLAANSSPVDPSASQTDGAGLDTLRHQIASLSSEVAQIVESRARKANRAVVDAVETVGSTARASTAEYPIATMAAAFAAGAVVGILLLEARKPEPLSRFDSARHDLETYAADLKRSLQQSARNVSMSDRLERMAGALSATDAKATIAPAFERVVGWLGQAKDQAKTMVDAAAAKVTST